MTPPPRRRCPF
uniref:CYP75A12/F3'5'H1 n=1 Tax=Arundo donax TaxID=35708 RepID=A0A0A9GCC3_ARUDO